MVGRAPPAAGMVGLVLCSLERRLVREPAVARLRGPWVVAAARSGAPTIPGLAARAGLAAAEPGSRPVRPVHLGGRIAQGRADVIDLDLVHGPLLALPRLVLTLAQAPGHDDPHAALQALRYVLRGLTPDVAGQEERFPVLPLVGVAVHVPGRRCNPEGGDRLAGRGVPKLWVIDEVADDRDIGVACCHRGAPARSVGSELELIVRPQRRGRVVERQCASGLMTFVRRTASLRFSW